MHESDGMTTAGGDGELLVFVCHYLIFDAVCLEWDGRGMGIKLNN